MIVVIGDLHLNDNTPWGLEFSQTVVSYLSKMPYNISANIAIFLGDLTEDPLNSGIIYDLLSQLFYKLSFKKIYIVVGNHDLRRRAGIETTPYDFLKSDSRVQICSIPAQQMVIEGFNCLFLPYFLPTPERPSVTRFYATLEGEFDFIFGHVADETATIIPENQRTDLSKLKGIKCLGHIHTPGEHIVGSVAAMSLKEISDERAIWIFDENKKLTKDPLPTFIDYKTVAYPDPLPAGRSLLSVYTFYGADEGTIRAKYGDIYIRRIIRNLDSNLETDLIKAAKITSLNDIKDTNKLIDQWLQTLKEKPSASLIDAIKKYATYS